MSNQLEFIASKFKVEGEVKDIRPLGDGLINDTFFIETTDNTPNYILQRKNKYVFTDIPAMMDNIYKVTTHLKKKIVLSGGDPFREALTLTPTKEGKLYFLDANEDYWTSCLFIEDTKSYPYASSLNLAYQGGKGIGKFQSLLSDMTQPLADILPGFHNIRFRLNQWDESIKQDKAGRVKDLSQEIQWIEERRDEMLAFWIKVEKRIIPIRVTHNDTKISNILFDQKGEVLCVIDLDTVLNSTCLNDFGDAIRSYANAGMEDDKDIDNVYLKMDVFESYTQGYLSEAKAFLIDEEANHLAFSAKYITYEQTLRFLMDYIDGDTYYKTAYETHNLVRTHAQYKLLQSMEENFEEMKDIVSQMISNQP